MSAFQLWDCAVHLNGKNIKHITFRFRDFILWLPLVWVNSFYFDPPDLRRSIVRFLLSDKLFNIFLRFILDSLQHLVIEHFPFQC